MSENLEAAEIDSLKMSFEPQTIEHLGVKMYSHIPPALAELIANAYDACANSVHVKLYDEGDKRIVVEDDGTGMSFHEINEYFLRIGRNRRKEHQESACDRQPTGKKGLGKLALFGIGDLITISTIKDEEKVTFILDWNDIINCSDKTYEPHFNIEKAKGSLSGTTIILESLKKKSGFPIDEYVVSISKLFNFKAHDFSVTMSKNDGEEILIDSKKKYEDITPEFQWTFDEASKLIDSEFAYKDQISGLLMTTEKPLKPGLRGITLYANGRLVNSAEFFGRAESSHFFSYLTGWLDVNFIDNIDEDVISTDRQSINWEHELTSGLRVFLFTLLRALENNWRELRKTKRRETIKIKTSVDIPTWMSNVPTDVRNKLEAIINNIDDSELTQNQQNESIESLHLLIPDYPYFHWRHLDPEIQDAARADYERKDYYRAFIEAAKRFITETRNKSNSTNQSDVGMMGAVYGNGASLVVTHGFVKPDGNNFHVDTIKSIEEGQKFLAMGIVAGARNPVSHEEIIDLRESGLFTEKDCLDALSILSHLFRRLKNC